ncbi:MAG TPA: TolC family protein [Chitinophagales bacterium]|nr:TolC family protein [Chitinophagales bacterium]
MKFIYRGNLLFYFLILSISLHAEDTLKINIHQGDSIFLKNSFYLMAASMNIEAQKAQILQAKLYPNPTFSAEFNLYDPENKKVFHLGKNGQMSFALEQLIIIGGKRKKEIEMAKTNASISELEFQQLVKNLKYELHTHLFSIGQQEFLLHKYNQQLTLLDSLLSAYQNQVDKGNIPMKDLVRLKGAYLKLNNDRAETFKEYYQSQSIVQKILQVSSVVKFDFDEDYIIKYIQPTSLEDLQANVSSNRPDLLILEQNNILSEQYIQYQKKLAIPDITVFTSYDQRSGVFRNEMNTGFSIPLPLWNRNQGNIKTAQFALQENQYNYDGLYLEILTNIKNSYAFYSQTVLEFEKSNTLYNEDFEITIQAMTTNFQKRNISIIEFIDFFESYNEVLMELSRIKTQLVGSAEELNLLTGTDIF